MMKQKTMAVKQKMMMFLKQKIMTNRKMMICLAVILLAAVGIAVIFPLKPDASEDGMQKMLAAQERINLLLTNPEYQNAALEEKLEKAKALVDELQQERLIRSVRYDSDQLTFSFEFANGLPGGIVLKDFSVQPGKIPMG